MTVHVTVPLDEDQRAELERIAKHEGTSLEGLLVDLAKRKIKHDAWLRAEIQKGIDSVDNEPLIDHDVVFTELRERIHARSRAK